MASMSSGSSQVEKSSNLIERSRPMATKKEVINGLCFVTPFVRLGFHVEGIDPDRLEQIKEAIRGFFPEWTEDEWWWALYQHERILVGQIDGRSFDEETGYIQATEDGADEVPWMDRVAVAVWQANLGFCRFSFETASIPYDHGYWEHEDFVRLTSQRPGA